MSATGAFYRIRCRCYLGVPVLRYESLHLSVSFYSIVCSFAFGCRHRRRGLPFSGKLRRRSAAGTIPAFVPTGPAAAVALAITILIVAVGIRRQSHRLHELIERPG